MQFSGNFEQILGSGPPWGQNCTGPPDQNPGSTPENPDSTVQTTEQSMTPKIHKRRSTDHKGGRYIGSCGQPCWPIA